MFEFWGSRGDDYEDEMTVFWDVAPCSLVEGDTFLRCLLSHGSDVGGSMQLWNGIHFLRD
jgi:hypothetical protein